MARPCRPERAGLLLHSACPWWASLPHTSTACGSTGALEPGRRPTPEDPWDPRKCGFAGAGQSPLVACRTFFSTSLERSDSDISKEVLEQVPRSGTPRTATDQRRRNRALGDPGDSQGSGGAGQAPRFLEASGRPLQRVGTTVDCDCGCLSNACRLAAQEVLVSTTWWKVPERSHVFDVHCNVTGLGAPESPGAQFRRRWPAGVHMAGWGGWPSTFFGKIGIRSFQKMCWTMSSPPYEHAPAEPSSCCWLL
eukprot:gene20800-biopygen2607